MITMNQIAGADGFNIMDNLRLIVIAAIFIIGVFIYILFIMKNRGRTKQRYMPPINPYESGNKESKHMPEAEDDFLSIEDKMKSQKAEDMENKDEYDEYGLEMEEKSVSDLEDIETEIKDIKGEITANTGELTSKIEEGDKAVVEKLETLINSKVNEVVKSQANSTVSLLEKLADSLRSGEKSTDASITGEQAGVDEAEASKQGKPVDDKGVLEKLVASIVQEALKDVNHRINDALRSQKNSTALVLDEMINTLRKEDVSSGNLPSVETEKTVEEKIEPREEKVPEIPAEDKDILGGLASSLKVKEEPAGVSKAADMNKAVPDEVKGRESIAAKSSPEKIEETVSEKAVEESDDLDLEELFKEEPIGFSSAEESSGDAEGKPADAVVSSGKIEEKKSEAAGAEKEKNIEEMEDLDIQDFLEELGLPPSEKDLKSDK